MKIVLHNRYPVGNLPEDIRPDDVPAGTLMRVVLEPALSDEEEMAEFERKIQEGLDELDAGQGIPLEDVEAEMLKRFGPLADAAE